jgi:hypothetical protein
LFSKINYLAVSEIGIPMKINLVVFFCFLFSNLAAQPPVDSLSFQQKAHGKHNKKNAKTGLWKYYHDNGSLYAVGKHSAKHEILTYSLERRDSLIRETGLANVVFPYHVAYKKGKWSYFNTKGELRRIEYYGVKGRLRPKRTVLFY